MRFLAVLLLVSLSLQAGILRDILQKRSASHQSNQLTDISYGDDKKQRFDLYKPDNAYNAPMIVMVHGGAWKMGDKKSDNVVLNKMNRWVSKGIIFVSLNYRLYPKVKIGRASCRERVLRLV